MSTAFVTGGTGFVGINIVALLRERGWRVVAIHRKGSNTRHLVRLGAELAEAGLDDAALLARVMPEGVDAVFHVAGDISWWRGNDARQKRANVDGTRHVVEAALARGAKRFIHTSSVAAYGLVDGVVSERTVSHATTSGIGYLRTKWQAEQEVRKGIERGLPAVLINPGNVLGAYDVTGWARLFTMIKAGTLPGVPPGNASFCDGREVAAAHVEAVTRGTVGENYLTGGTDATYAELAAIIAELLGKKPPRAIPGFVMKAVGRVNQWKSVITRKEPDVTPESATLVCARWSIDPSKAERELGFKRRPLRPMLEDSFRWLQAEGLI
jgi:nucleoside-diphosphate-sugar epimerase